MIPFLNSFKKLYDGIYCILPDKLKASVSKFLFNYSGKPFYDDSNNLNLEKPIVCISADFEMAWAWRYSKRVKDAVEMGRTERNNFPIILENLNSRNIPITWATVGHLFLDHCERKNEKAHSDLPRPDYFENEYWEFKEGDWYDSDPCTDYKKNPEFYAPDLIEKILNSNVNHEIACHSFSHCDFSEENSNEKLIEAELNICIDLMKSFGIEPVSFIFPGNRYGNFDIIKQAGFKVIRYKSNAVKEIGYPEKLQNNLIAIHDSLNITSGNLFDYKFLYKKFKRYVKKTIENKSICHFWFHPSISQNDIDYLFNPVIDYLAELRDRDYIEIMTMKDIYKRFYD